jgi:hypothetical protein
LIRLCGENWKGFLSTGKNYIVLTNPLQPGFINWSRGRHHNYGMVSGAFTPASVLAGAVRASLNNLPATSTYKFYKAEKMTAVHQPSRLAPDNRFALCRVYSVSPMIPVFVPEPETQPLIFYDQHSYYRRRPE